MCAPAAPMGVETAHGANTLGFDDGCGRRGDGPGSAEWGKRKEAGGGGGGGVRSSLGVDSGLRMPFSRPGGWGQESSGRPFEQKSLPAFGWRRSSSGGGTQEAVVRA